MKNAFDYDEQAMSQCLPAIQIPIMAPLAYTPRSSYTSVTTSNHLDDLKKILQQQKEDEARRIQSLKCAQSNVSQKIESRISNRQRKIGKLELEQRKRIESECTFKPKTATHMGSKRSFGEFLNLQDQFQQKIQQKRVNLKMNLQALNNHQETFHPKINKKGSKPQSTKGKDTNVFSRLYSLRNKQNWDINHEATEQFHPQITEKSKKLERRGPVGDHLYQDALRRQQKSRQMSSSVVHKKQRSYNLNNERYVAQKFIKQYCNVLERFDFGQETNSEISYLMFNEILVQMGFVHVQQQSEDSQERKLVHQAYQILSKYSVNVRNLSIFLLAIIGVFNVDPINFENQVENQKETFNLDEVEGRKLQRTFDCFKRNRLFSQYSRKEVEPDAQNFPFHPKINKSSSEMAQKYRNQMLQEANRLLEQYPQLEKNIPADGVITHADLLTLGNLSKNIRIGRQKQQKQQRKMQQCTFKPATLSSAHQSLNNSLARTENGLGDKKSLQLYNSYKDRQVLKQNKQVNKLDTEMQECTFAPDINHTRVYEDTSKFNSKEVQETLLRMKKGRDQWQEKKRIMERGEPNRHDKIKVQTEQSQDNNSDYQGQRTPILLLDINLGNRHERISLYEDDYQKITEIAKQFSRKHKLEEGEQEKLCELLKLQMDNVLVRIDQENNSEDDNL